MDTPQTPAKTALLPVDWSVLSPANMEAHITGLRETRPDLFDGRNDWVEGVASPGIQTPPGQILTSDSRQPRDLSSGPACTGEPPYQYDEPELIY